jgi:gamma-glutamyltranspeptidase/glutathione hydrolase
MFWLIQSATAFRTRMFWAMESLEVPGVDLSLPTRHTRATAEALWKAAQDGRIPSALVPGGTPSDHSEGIAVVDRWGNVVAMTHTINTGAWGNTGINVDGISIPDSAKFQQVQIANAGPGVRLPDPTSPLIVTRDGKPVISIGSIGSGLHYKTLCALTSMLDFDMDPKEAIDIGALMDSFAITGDVQAIGEGEFEPALISAVEAMGQQFRIDDEAHMGGGRGYLVVAAIDPETGRLEAACPGEFYGGAEAY